MASVMRSTSQRPPSPTFTTISGISNYRSDSYRSRPTGQSQQEIKATAHSHYKELTGYLATLVAKELPGARANAREKLTRLTRQQFMELSTDVYDELIRRNANPNNEEPFLPHRDVFHPKRNQARQKLASLPRPRFKDLASDVYFELGRRNPEFREDNLVPPDTPGSQYGSEPSPGFNVPPMPKNPYAQSGGAPDPYRRPSADDYRRPSGDDYRRPSGDDMRRTPDDPIRKPSGDDTISLGGVSLYGRRPSNAASPENGFSRRPSEREANAGTATAAIIIPAKSTIATEEIQTPFAGDRNSAASSTRQEGGDSDEGAGTEDAKDDGGVYYDNSAYGGNGSSPAVSRSNTMASSRDDAERLRRDYEFKIATMQNKLNALENEVSEALRLRDESEDMVQKLNQDLDDLRVRSDDQAATIRELERDLEDARAGGGGGAGGTDPATLSKLRGDMENLLEEVKDLSIQNDALIEEKDQDAATIRDLDSQVKEYKRKYEQAKTELRGFKATSQLFLQAQSFSDDQLPVTQDGVLLDIHVTAFQSAIDSVLTTGRSSAPSGVLQPMKSVVDAVSALLDDVAKSAQAQSDVARALTERTQATLNNLLTAARTHATSYGMAPVSLLDAAASHVALSVTELGKLLRIRRATKPELDAWERIQAGGSRGESRLNGHAPSLSKVNGNGNGLARPSPSPEVGFRGGGGETWDDVRPKIEAPSDTILKDVQTVLAGIRTANSRALADPMSEIVALVGNVVALCRQGGVPPRGAGLVRELSEHVERLSGQQALIPRDGGELSKDARQEIAKASFGIANALKELLKV
ncbi:hypothetical protein EXIGLDRAFT_842250 [Exidia glandulosa HHB12029]|uniref:GIT Spa2 homology (SHD) domain-containing protein n=1 Tax=Exidia glandulosa HHB12029 TaxID=1314781 RepID=A0A165DEK5_EXIGL|nr:hypothetical protein EXIGLDRAFT_842250 [Exidia glandulosa HHB12029]